MSDNRKEFEEWAVSNCVFTEGDIAYGTSDVKAGFKIWQAATEQSSKEIERLNALVAMQAGELKEAVDMVKEISMMSDERPTEEWFNRMDKALSASSSTVSKWEAEKLLPLQRQVAMLVEHLTDSQMHDIGRMQFERNKEALSNTQATAEAYDREHAAKVLEEALDICESEANEPNEGMSDFADGYDAACKEIREQIKHRIAELRATKQVKE